jgi:hypothetical protein
MISRTGQAAATRDADTLASHLLKSRSVGFCPNFRQRVIRWRKIGGAWSIILDDHLSVIRENRCVLAPEPYIQVHGPFVLPPFHTE